MWDGRVVDLSHPRFPRSSGYDGDWLLSLDMGPNPLWLLEDLLADVHVAPSSRVLDLGCGRGATSVFLARELGVEVWAVDLWVPALVIESTLAEAGVAGSVHPINADARDLPFDDESFDAVVCIDAWEYFGTEDDVLPGLLRVLRPGGAVGVATPAMRAGAEQVADVPAHIRAVVGSEALAWHPPDRWRRQWEATGLVTDVRAREAPTGWEDWLRWARATDADGSIVDMLLTDGGEQLTFALVSGTKA